MDKRMDRGQFRRARTLIRRLCANCDGGNCILLDDGEPCACPQLLTPSIICRYFRSCVLPADRELFSELAPTRSTRRCLICGAPFFSGSNAAKYCPRCAVRQRRKKDAERKQKRRSYVRNRALETRITKGFRRVKPHGVRKSYAEAKKRRSICGHFCPVWGAIQRKEFFYHA